MFHIKHFNEVGSTNSTSWEMIKSQEAAEGTVILSGFQHQGKGQQGNSWHSEKDKNLLVSVILQPDFLDVEKHFYLSMVVSLAVHHTLSGMQMPAMIKWPNDLLVHEHKIGGLLIENALERNVITHSVVGIGMNVNQQQFPPELSSATSISNELGREVDLSQILDELLENMARYYQKLKLQLFPELDRLYRDALFGYHEWHLYRDKQGDFKGSVVDIKPDGQLGIVNESGEKRYYYFKEVEWLKS